MNETAVEPKRGSKLPAGEDEGTNPCFSSRRDQTAGSKAPCLTQPGNRDHGGNVVDAQRLPLPQQTTPKGYLQEGTKLCPADNSLPLSARCDKSSLSCLLLIFKPLFKPWWPKLLISWKTRVSSLISSSLISSAGSAQTHTTATSYDCTDTTEGCSMPQTALGALLSPPAAPASPHASVQGWVGHRLPEPWPAGGAAKPVSSRSRRHSWEPWTR